MKTIIHIRAFNTNFDIELTRHSYVSMELCKAYVKRNMQYDTAQIEYIKQGKKRIKNTEYKAPFELVPVIAKRYLKGV